MGSVALAASGGAVGAFVLEFRSGSGEVSSAGLSQCWNTAFERCPPVRGFPSYRGQRSFSGSWWFATTGEHVGFESWLERDHVIALDADPAVVGIASQPFWIRWRDVDGERRHAPDFFVRKRDGSGLVLDVRADDRIEPRDAEAFEATGRACASVGWAFRRAGALDPVLAANRRWLAGYRHQRCLRPGLTAPLTEVFTVPTALMAGAAAVGDPVAVLPTLFHLLWSGHLSADLVGSLLDGSTEVSVR